MADDAPLAKGLRPTLAFAGSGEFVPPDWRLAGTISPEDYARQGALRCQYPRSGAGLEEEAVETIESGAATHSGILELIGGEPNVGDGPRLIVHQGVSFNRDRSWA